MNDSLFSWLWNTPTHLTEDEALERAVVIVREMAPVTGMNEVANEMLVMLMQYWASKTHDYEFKARFYDFKKKA